MYIKLPDTVQKIIEKLEENDYEAYIVGGCVRDICLGKEPKDWDITTSALPEEVKKIFSKTIDTGIKHGTVTVVLNGGFYEITTYRIDGKYSDNRHPEEVLFTPNLEEDLKRRDFTINAMAYNPKVGLVDLFEGEKDIEDRIIRCVGIPDERFNEDGLRMLRAVRFSAQHGFIIAKETYEAIKKNAELIKNISAERIRDEITKIITSQGCINFLLLNELGLLEYIMPEFIPNIGCPQNSPWHKYTVCIHTIKAMERIENTVEYRWTMLLHDIAKAECRTTDKNGHDHFVGHPERGAEMAEVILKRLKFDNKTIKKIVSLIKNHDRSLPLDKVELRKEIAKIGIDLMEQLLTVMDADDSAKAEAVWIESREKTLAIRALIRFFKETGCCLKREDLDITGDDLIEIGFTEGRKIGKVLDKLFNEVLENPELNDNYELKKLAENILARGETEV